MFLRSIQACMIIGMVTYAGLATAASFSLNKSSNAQLKETSQTVPKTKDIMVTGYGLTEDAALKTAFRSAVEQYVGIVIDSSTIMENSALIEDSLLTSSNGFIQTYKKLSTSKKNGVVVVKILATVQSQKLVQEIHSLHIATVSISGTKDVAARIETKQIAKKDALKMLSKDWSEAWSDEAMLDLLSVNIDNVKLLEDQVNGQNQVPLRVTYSISVNRDNYKATIAKLETLLKQLGAKYHAHFDLPDVKKNGSIHSNLARAINSPPSSFMLLMKHYGKGLAVDMWELPAAWKFNHFAITYLSSISHLILEIKDQQGEVLYPTMFKVPSRITLFRSALNWVNYLPPAQNQGRVVVPFLFNTSFTWASAVERLSYSVDIPVNLEDVKKIGNISLELEKI